MNLNKLDEDRIRHALEYWGKDDSVSLLNPESELTIAVCEARLGVRLPAPLRFFYQICGGFDDHVEDGRFFHMNSLAELAVEALFRGPRGVNFGSALICSHFFILDLELGRVLLSNSAEFPRVVVVSRSLPEFLYGLARGEDLDGLW